MYILSTLLRANMNLKTIRFFLKSVSKLFEKFVPKVIKLSTAPNHRGR